MTSAAPAAADPDMIAKANPCTMRTTVSAAKDMGTRYRPMHATLTAVPMTRERFTPQLSILFPKNSRVANAAMTYTLTIAPPTLCETPYVSTANSVILTMMR